MFKKTKTMRFSELVEVKKAEYVTLQLIPTKSNKNNQTGTITSLINKTYAKLFGQLLRIEDKKLIIEHRSKVSFYIRITKKETQFFFMIPKIHLNLFKTKFVSIWKNIEIKEIDQLPIDINEFNKYQLKYKFKDSLSLNIDKRSNDLLSANMSVLEILENDEEVGILYNFIPVREKESNYFKTVAYENDIKDYKSGKNLKQSKNIIDLGVITLKFLIDYLNEFINGFSNKKTLYRSSFLSAPKEVSSSTERKIKGDLCKTQIVVLTKAKDITRREQLATSTCNSFKAISDDNELVSKRINKHINIISTVLEGVKENYTSEDELQNFICLPGKELIDNYKNINHNEIVEKAVPDCLQKGNMLIGDVKYKENTQKAYFSSHEQIKRAERVLIGPKGSGKSHKTINMAVNAINIGRGVQVIDIIEDCKLSQEIAKNTPKDKLVRVNCADINYIQAFSYNEIPINDNMKPFEIVSNAIKRGQQLHVLLDSINSDTSQLTARMIKYLYAASAIVYSVKPKASLTDIIDCLSYVEIREKYISILSDELSDLLENRIKKLNELNKIEKTKTVNYDNKIDGILDRVSMLELSLETELALNKTSENNINFVDMIQQNKVVLIEIPEDVFTNSALKNVMATFFLSKIWLAKKQLSKNQKAETELYFDEFYKCPNAAQIFEEIFAEGRKYNLVSTVTLHSVYELSNKCRSQLRSGGASYMLLYGCDIQNFKYLNEYFINCGYEEDDLINLKEYHALCLIKNEEKNYSSFIAKLPA